MSNAIDILEHQSEHSLQGVIYFNITVSKRSIRKNENGLTPPVILNNSDSAPNLNGLGINFGDTCFGDTHVNGDTRSGDNFFTELINKTTGCFWLSNNILFVILSNASTQFVVIHIRSVFTKAPKTSNFLTIFNFENS